MFMCVSVLAACSPRQYQREQAARTFNQETAFDSTSVRAILDRLVQEEVQKQLEIQENIEVTSVKEVLSSPDSTGLQYVQERTTTTTTSHKTTSAASHEKKEEKTQAVVDSARVNLSESTIEKEEETVINKKTKGFFPWYMYLVALAGAVLIGFVLHLRKGKWGSWSGLF